MFNKKIGEFSDMFKYFTVSVLFFRHYIQIHWKQNDSHKKKVLEMAAKMWRNFKERLNKNFHHKGKDRSELYNYVSQEQ